MGSPRERQHEPIILPLWKQPWLFIRRCSYDDKWSERVREDVGMEGRVKPIEAWEEAAIRSGPETLCCTWSPTLRCVGNGVGH